MDSRGKPSQLPPKSERASVIIERPSVLQGFRTAPWKIAGPRSFTILHRPVAGCMLQTQRREKALSTFTNLHGLVFGMSSWWQPSARCHNLAVKSKPAAMSHAVDIETDPSTVALADRATLRMPLLTAILGRL